MCFHCTDCSFNTVYEIVACCCKNCVEHTGASCGQSAVFWLLILTVRAPTTGLKSWNILVGESERSRTVEKLVVIYIFPSNTTNVLNLTVHATCFARPRPFSRASETCCMNLLALINYLCLMSVYKLLMSCHSTAGDFFQNSWEA
jgi:hypothetical protein